MSDHIYMPAKRVYNLQRDYSDPRDHIYRLDGTFKAPPHVDLRSVFPVVFDQGQLGSCTGNAWMGNLGHVHAKNGQGMFVGSRLMTYYGERAIEHTISKDAGAQIRDGAKFLAQHGVCPETMWPYDISKFKKKPGKDCYAVGMGNRITSYQRITSLDGMIQCLAEGWPVTIGFAVYESFESYEVAKTGMMPMPHASEQCLGGHAVLVVGYDLMQQRLIVKNSWSDQWGDKGHFYMPFAYITTPGLADDFWTVRK